MSIIPTGFTFSFGFVLGVASIFLSSHLYAATEVKVLFLGDSLCAGYGVELENAFPNLIDNKLKTQPNTNVTVINASISGSTSASGYSRLRWGLKNKPDILVLELGANDGLRGLDLSTLEKNLAKTIQLALDHNTKVLLAGMQIPPNYGEKYAQQFKQTFEKLAVRFNIPLIPFLLKDVAGNPKLNTADGIHPNAEGHKVISTTVLKYLIPMIKQ